MEKAGWGVTLDSDPVGFFMGKPAVGLSLAAHHNNSGIMFPVNMNSREDQPASSPATANNENQVAVGEVDFFKEKIKSSSQDHDSKTAAASSTIVVKKENSHSEATPRTGLDVNTGLHLLTANTRSDQSTVDDSGSSDVEEKRAKKELALLQGELERINADNQRLRGMLTQVSNNYSALQMHLVTLMQRHQTSLSESTREHEIVEERAEEKKHEIGVRPVVAARQFMELGPSGSGAAETDEAVSPSSSEERTLSGSPPNKANHQDAKRAVREDSPESKGWVPNKVPKLNVTKVVDQAAEATMRKARVSVRARSEASMISDGCQWRKYGQKMAKGNPCPRAYYRCTMAVGCPVRKQVQRCAEDRTVLITTYEGTHNHPLPPAAMAMASTTSAAANMLLSGSMTSADGIMNPNFLARTILPYSSNMATISASAPFPTITLDLTHSPTPLLFQRAQPQIQVPFSGQIQNFASMPTPPLPQLFGQTLYNQSKFSGLQVSQGTEPTQLVVAQRQTVPQPPQQQHASFADTLSAATAAITADPNFTAALAAAISSIIGGAHPNNNDNNVVNNNNPATPTTTSNSNKSSSFQGH